MRKLNPLGIRKVDYQQERREAERAARNYSKNGWVQMPEEWQFAVAAAYMRGWEDGAKVGVQATKGRVREALTKGTLVKP